MSENLNETAEAQVHETNGHLEDRLMVSCKRKEFFFDIELADGKIETWSIREMMGDERDSFLNLNVKNAKFHKRTGTAMGVKKVDGQVEELLCRCMFNSQGNPVPKAYIRKNLPAGAQAKLFMKAQELSGLTIESQEDEKND